MLCSSKPSKLFTALLAVLLLDISLNAEVFRVHDVKSLAIDPYGEKTSVSAGINDAIILELPEDMTYVQGIELNFKVPQLIATWRDSVAWSFYTGLTPSPEVGKIDYSGTRSTTGTFGTSLSLNMQIPLHEDNDIKQNPYSCYVETLPEIIDNKIFIRLQLAMKGTPDSISSEKIEISAKPILINKGKLFLKLVDKNGNECRNCSIYIDEKAIENRSSGILLDTGVHNLNIMSDDYRNEIRTISIDQAKQTAIRIEMMDIIPQVRIVSPANTVIYIDDSEISNQDSTDYFVITEGMHTFRFIIGDYEITKTLNAINGNSYTISVSLDAAITQDE